MLTKEEKIKVLKDLCDNVHNTLYHIDEWREQREVIAANINIASTICIRFYNSKSVILDNIDYSVIIDNLDYKIKCAEDMLNKAYQVIGENKDILKEIGIIPKDSYVIRMVKMMTDIIEAYKLPEFNYNTDSKEPPKTNREALSRLNNHDLMRFILDGGIRSIGCFTSTSSGFEAWLAEPFDKSAFDTRYYNPYGI